VDPFATLGFARQYAIDKAQLDRRYRELQQALHPDRNTSAPASERALTLQKAVTVNEAYRVLRDDQKRAEALLQTFGATLAEQSADPEMLMEMMELREALSEARAAREVATVTQLASTVRDKADAAQRELASAFAAIESKSAPRDASLAAAQTLLGRLRYYRRFQEEVAQFEDEALA
jgi:molecular chaperone HscB